MNAPDTLHAEVTETATAIAEMEIRGAATIAGAAARALGAQAAASTASSPEEFRSEMRVAARVLHDTRPTAVSLPNALRYVLNDLHGDTVEDLRATVDRRVTAFLDQLAHAQDELGRFGGNRLRDGDTIMTHCHSTDVVACVRAAVEEGKELTAYVRETRPRNQGHITAHELTELGVDVTLIVDNAARHYLNEVDHVLVGADSIAADGSVINKIGTSGLAVNARDMGTQVMVAAQTIKLHPATMTGHTVEIEERDAGEVISEADRAEIGTIRVENPAFDVTPPRYVDAIVTERGQFPPESIVILMRELFGERVTNPWESP
ncbi:ribose 1,5-bisphosphate isomerase [Haladaptatus sp. DYSN1]|uniref:ribose 1,5-bisphosphate isomerase n=1 Tax=unclassified Haladaptatus TaxID=2622732 RepID=UPI002405BE7B|nr:ribose 1,5-bisphosphate isomerase [Haladaptatus sp. DYSN1]